MVGALSSEHGNNMANKLELANNMANMTKSNLDNIVGSLWQARQESSGSSRGDQVSKNLSWCFVGRDFVGRALRIKVLALFPSPALTADQPEHGKWSRTDLKTPPQQLVPVTCESLVSREFSRILLTFHFSISISRHFHFTFHSQNK